MSAQSPGATSISEGLEEGNGQASHEFQPFVPSSAEPPELTLSALGLGAILGIVFGASSLYLSLKVGLTVSASIPVAVLSITLYRALGRGKGRDPREQHRADGRLGRRVDRLRRRRHDAGAA